MSSRRTSDSLERLRDYGRRNTVYGTERAWEQEPAHRTPRRTRRIADPANTLGPQEDVMERREREYRHRVTTVAQGEDSGSGISENLFLLAVLAGSIYGLYRLCIYLLMQGM